MAEAKPTIFVSVPRLYHRIYDGIMKQFKSAQGFKKFLIDKACANKKYHMDVNNSLDHPFWDRLIFNKIK